MAKEARPGMGQDEKDKIGQEAHEARQKDLALQEAAAGLPGWRPDDTLEALDAEGLRAEAETRGVALPKTISNPEAVKRLTARRREVETWVRDRDQRAAAPPTGA